MSASSLFPMFLKLEGRSCLVLGAGGVGEPKIQHLVECGAFVRVIAPSASEVVQESARRGSLIWIQREFEPADLEGVFLVVAASSSSEVNHAVYREARARGILCNVVDDPPHCDFYYPAVVRRGQLQIAISTAGLSPALAQRIRKQLEQQFPPAYGTWLESLGERRQQLFAGGGDSAERRRILHEIASPDSFLEYQRNLQIEARKEVL